MAILFLVFIGICKPQTTPNLLLHSFHQVVLKKQKSYYLKNAIDTQKDTYKAEAYTGVYYCLLANEVISPIQKLKYCKYGLHTLNTCIGKNNDVEFIYLRYSIEYSIPSFLNMSKHLQYDKQALIEYAKSSTRNELYDAILSLFENIKSEDKEINNFLKQQET